MPTWMTTASDHDALRHWAERLLQDPSAEPACKLPFDLAAYLGHLCWLRAGLEAGTLAPTQLAADEANALRVLHQVQSEMEHRLKSGGLKRCPRCGAATEGFTCRACAFDFTRAPRRTP